MPSGFESLKMLLPVELLNGNRGQSKHWGDSHRAKKQYLAVMRALYGKEKVATPCKIVVTRILGPGQSLWDYDSVLRGTAKQAIDSLVTLGIIPGDDPRYVVEVIGRQDDSRREDGPATLLEVIPVEIPEETALFG